MKIKLEIESADALELCVLHNVIREQAIRNRRYNPEACDKVCRLVKEFREEFSKKVPADELERITNPGKKEQLEELVKKWEKELADIGEDLDTQYHKGSDYDMGMYDGQYSQLTGCINDLKQIIEQAK